MFTDGTHVSVCLTTLVSRSSGRFTDHALNFFDPCVLVRIINEDRSSCVRERKPLDKSRRHFESARGDISLVRNREHRHLHDSPTSSMFAELAKDLGMCLVREVLLQ